METQAVEEIIELGLHARFNAKVLSSEGAHIRPPMQACQRKEVDGRNKGVRIGDGMEAEGDTTYFASLPRLLILSEGCFLVWEKPPSHWAGLYFMR